MVRSGLTFGGLLAFAACGGTELPPCEVSSSDIRVDAAGDGDQIESTGTLMCVNSQGTVYVAWVDDREVAEVPALYMNISTDGGDSWLPAAIKVNHGTGKVTRPALACTDNAVYVAWEDDRDGELENHNIYFNVSTDQGKTFLEDDMPLDNDPDGLTFSQGPYIATAGSDVYVAWFDNVNGAYDILLASSNNQGAKFSSPIRVDSDQPAGIAYSAWPQVVADTGGNVYVTWEDARDGGNDIYFARSTNAAASFSPDVRIDTGDDPGANNSFAPKLGVSGSNVYIVWHDKRNGTGGDVYGNYSSDGGKNWQEAYEVESTAGGNTPGFFNSRFPAIYVENDVAHVAWEDARNDGYDIYYRQMIGGVPQGDLEDRLDIGIPDDRTSEPGFWNSVNTQMAGDAGKVAVAWQDDRSAVEGSGYDDLYYEYNEGTGWFEQDLRIDSIQQGASFKLDLQAAVVGTNLYAAWTDGRGGTSDVYFHRITLGEESQYITEQGECQPASGTAATAQ